MSSMKYSKYPKLMTPGPTNVPEAVREAMARPMMHHRTEEFRGIFAEFTENLKYVFRTKNDVFVLASSGTGGMEAAVCNFFSEGDRVIVCNNGKFGERFAEICRRYGLDVLEIKYDWGEAARAEDISRNLKDLKNVKGVFVTQSETSTGVCNDIAGIGKAVNQSGALLVVDSISALGSMDMRADEWGIDVVLAGSQKALMGPPGLCFVSVSGKAWDFYGRSSLPKYYFDLGKYRKKFPETPYTPAIAAIIGMNESLRMIRQKGIDGFLGKHEELAGKLRKGIAGMGLELFPKSGLQNNGLTVVKSPEGLDSQEIINGLKSHGYVVSNGQEGLKGKVFRIATMGDVEEKDVNGILEALGEVLEKLKADK